MLFKARLPSLLYGRWATVIFGMPTANAHPATDPYELWEQEGVLYLKLGNSVPIDPWTMKEILRGVSELDPSGDAPILVEQQELVRMTADAKSFLVRACKAQSRPVAFMAYDLPDRIQGEFFVRFHKPVFPFRVFGARDHAMDWFSRFASGLHVVR